jgi:1-acyl-sn-glycerol-3-phosphate acyltransferase
LLYHPLLFIIRLALKIFCVSIKIQNKEALQQKGPLLIVANHPNSFFDALVIAVNTKYPISFLARGDVFTRPWHNFLLRALNMMPVYRQKEGKEHLHKNKNSFDASVEVLKQGGIVLIFIEGVCLNKNEIQPFKKGAARILQQAVTAGVTPAVVPAVITYNGFKHFGKKIYVMIGKKVDAALFFSKSASLITPAEARNNFNQHCRSEMLGIYNLPPTKNYKRPLYLLPVIGLAWIAHSPLFFIIRSFVAHRTKGSVFYDSVFFALLLFGYPLYLLLLYIILIKLNTPHTTNFLIVCAHPLFALIYTQTKK